MGLIARSRPTYFPSSLALLISISSLVPASLLIHSSLLLPSPYLAYSRTLLPSFTNFERVSSFPEHEAFISESRESKAKRSRVTKVERLVVARGGKVKGNHRQNEGVDGPRSKMICTEMKIREEMKRELEKEGDGS